MEIADRDYNESDPHFVDCVAKKKFSEAGLHFAGLLTNLALLQDHAQAENLHRSALDIARLGLTSNDPQLATFLGGLAWWHYGQRQFEEGDRLHEEAIRVLDAAYRGRGRHVTGYFLKLFRFWAEQGNWDRVREYVSRGTKSIEKPLGSHCLEVAYWCDSVAQRYLGFDHAEEAVPFIERSVGIREHLGDFGNSDQGDPIGAAPKVFDRLRTLISKQDDHADFVLARCDQILGCIALSFGDLECANGWLQKALERASASSRQDYEIIANCNMFLALILRNTGKKAEGARLARKALEELSPVLGKSHYAIEALEKEIIESERDLMPFTARSSMKLVSGVSYQERGGAIRVGRNDPCPCSSGKKYKHCCLRKNGLH